ncbi:MAG: hypothetical protein ABIS67_10910 [Candidatus Eisenbacteria bacterium]
MIRPRAAALAALTVWCAASGCTTLQEIPRTQYTAASERKAVRVLTRDSLLYEFDYATVTNDTLTGYRRLEVSGPAPEYTSMALPLEAIEKLSSRRVDWYRTTLIGGIGILGVAGAGLASEASRRGDPGGSPGGDGRVP